MMMFRDRLQPVKRQSGFKMDGYYVWCGSVLYENGKYYLFAARWPEEATFPDGYMKESEIVLATTDSLDRPFQFEKVIIHGRGGHYWDGQMAHNPFIMKHNGKYILFYIGSPDGTMEKRTIGYATADSVYGEWTRCEQPLRLPINANNPSVLFRENGEMYLYFRDGDLKVSVATAPSIEGPFTVRNNNCLVKGRIEDMYVYPDGDGFTMIAEDADGAYTGLRKCGVFFHSADGIHWDNEHTEQAYTFHVEMEDGTALDLQRRERPMILFGADRDYLFTTAKINGPDQRNGGKTWNMVQEVRHG